MVTISLERFFKLKGDLELSKNDSIKIAEQIHSNSESHLDVNISPNKIIISDVAKENDYLRAGRNYTGMSEEKHVGRPKTFCP